MVIYSGKAGIAMRVDQWVGVSFGFKCPIVNELKEGMPCFSLVIGKCR